MENLEEKLQPLLEAVKLAFDRENITIPFPQRDVHVFPSAE
jgi:small-conductance mechanosensitive channel